MIPPRQRYVFKNTILKWLSTGLVWALALSWFAWIGLLSTWVGTRPRTPSPATGQVIPYEDKGILYVTRGDLDTSRVILAICVVSGLLAFACYLADRKPWRRPISN